MTRRVMQQDIAASPFFLMDEQIIQVNQFWNTITYREDGPADYWQTPQETLEQGAGDCEDYAIAKYFHFRKLDYDMTRLYISYVKIGDIPHMVLIVDEYILDNLIDEVKHIDDRNDLHGPLYSFNEQDIVVAGFRSSALVIEKWSELLNRFDYESWEVPHG